MQADPAAFEYKTRLKFGTTIAYTTRHPVEAITEEGYFHNCRNYLQEVGDRLEVVCRHDDGSWSEGSFRVIERTPKRLTVFQDGEWKHFSVMPRRNLMAVEEGPGNWVVKTEDGDLVAKGLDQEMAEKLAGGTDNAPAAKPKPKPKTTPQRKAA